MKKIWYEIIFGLIKKNVVELLTGLVNETNHTKCISLRNQRFRNQPTLTKSRITLLSICG